MNHSATSCAPYRAQISQAPHAISITWYAAIAQVQCMAEVKMLCAAYGRVLQRWLGVELRNLGVELLRVELLRVKLLGLGVELRGLIRRRSLVVKLIRAVLLLHKLVHGFNVVHA